MMHAYAGQLLRVDLSSGTIRTEPLGAERARAFIGGRGLATKLFCDEVDANVEPLSPDNKLIFAAGPLTGTMAPCGGRAMVVTRGPLTGTIASSNVGGNFGPELKYAGFDMVVLEGVAAEPTVLVIDDGRAELRPAGDLWGQNVHQTEDLLHQQLGNDFKFMSIGPAGENRVRFASIMNDKHRAAGRSGVGAVMGSKKLKALAVRGTGGVKLAEPASFRQACLDSMAKLKAGDVTGTGLPAYGTAVLVNVINEHGAFPTRNWQEGTFGAAESISGETIAENILIRQRACFACPMACGRVTEIKGGAYSGHGEGPEYESVWSLGAATGVDDLAAVTKANYICNEMGMDTITAGSTVACAMELIEKGALDEAEVGGGLAFGDGAALVRLMTDIGLRRGFGAVLAEGGARVAAKYGRPELFMGSKKLEAPAYDARGIHGMGLQYATSNRGACHVRGYMVAPEILGIPEKLDPHTATGKAAMNIAFQDLTAAVDSAGVCLFVTFSTGGPELTELLKTATGFDYDLDEVVRAGERIWNMEKQFNLRAGFTKKDDSLPPRLLNEPLPTGPSAGRTVPLEEMLTEYYELRGWDAEGVPTPEKLKTLGL